MSIDIITLTASKNYTDKQIEKASMNGADLSKYVQSVNGVGPDKRGNVELSVENVDFVVQDTAPKDTSVLWVDPTDNTEDNSGSISITGAKVGQTIKIAEVDKNGVPTAWEAVEFPCVKEYELVEKIVCDGTVGIYAKTGLALKEVEIYIQTEAGEAAQSCAVELKNGSDLFGYAWLGNMINTGPRYAYVHGVSNGQGTAYLESAGPMEEKYRAAQMQRTAAKYDGTTPINRISIYCSGGALFPKDSIIEIWGIKE